MTDGGLTDSLARAPEDEQLRRWRLLLGSSTEPSLGGGLGPEDAAVDAALAALYDEAGG